MYDVEVAPIIRKSYAGLVPLDATTIDDEDNDS